MSLLPSTVASGGQIPSDLYFALKGDIPSAQVLSQNGNNVSLSGGGGSVNIAATTSVASSAQKTTAISYDTGFLATTINGELLIHGRTEVGEPLNPANLSVTGTFEVGGAISDNSTATGSAGQFLSAGAGGEVIWSTIPGGSGIAAVNAGTNISIPDPGIPVVSVAISSDLDMNGYNITTTENLTVSATGSLSLECEGVATLKSTSGIGGVAIQSTSAPITLSAQSSDINISADGNMVLESSAIVSVSNPSVGNGGAQLNVNGSASIRGDTAQLQILDNAGSQKGVLSYNVADGQTHLDATNLAISSGSAINVTSQDDLTLYAETGNVSITAHEANIALDSHTNIGISCNNGGVIAIGGVDTSQVNISTADVGSIVGINGETVNITGGILNANMGGAINLSTSGTLIVTTDDPITISTTGPTDTISITSASELTLSGTVGVTIDSHQDIGISCNNGGAINVGGVDTTTVSISSTTGGMFLTSDTVSVSADATAMITSTAITLTSDGGSGVLSMTDNVSLSGSGTSISAVDGPLDLNSGNGAMNLTSAGIMTLDSGSESAINMSGRGITLASTADGISMTSGANMYFSAPDGIEMVGNTASITTTGGGIELHSNGANLVLASAGDAVVISSGGGDEVRITGGAGGINCSTTNDIGLTSDSNIELRTTALGNNITLSAENAVLIQASSTDVTVSATGGNILLGSANLNMDSTTLSIPNSSAATNATLTATTLTMSDSTRITQVQANALNMIANNFLKININGDNGTIATTRTNNGDNLLLYNNFAGGDTTDGVPTISHYKDGRNANAGDIIGQNLYYAKDYTGDNIQFARIQASVRNNAVGNVDGSVSLSGLINGVMTEFFRVNGADSENNCFLPLDMNSNNITNVNNIQYVAAFSSANVTLNGNSSAIQTFNSGSATVLTATLPVVSATNVGRQFIITNTNIAFPNTLTVVSSGSQLIYSASGASNTTSRTLNSGHSRIFNAIFTGAGTYGWTMI